MTTLIEEFDKYFRTVEYQHHFVDKFLKGATAEEKTELLNHIAKIDFVALCTESKLRKEFIQDRIQAPVEGMLEIVLAAKNLDGTYQHMDSLLQCQTKGQSSNLLNHDFLEKCTPEFRSALLSKAIDLYPEVVENYMKHFSNRRYRENHNLKEQPATTAGNISKEQATLLDEIITKEKTDLAVKIIQERGVPGLVKSSKELVEFIQNLDEDNLKKIISSHVNNQQYNKTILDDKCLKAALDSPKLKSETKSIILMEAINKEVNNYYTQNNNSKLICQMALAGFTLPKEKISDLAANELKSNKSFLSSGKLTDNDAKRVMLMASADTLNVKKNYLKTHPGVSPLKMAIDTKQFNIAAKMIADGETLKPSELSIVNRIKRAVGLVKLKDVSIKLAGDMSSNVQSFTKLVKEQRNKKALSTVTKTQ